MEKLELDDNYRQAVKELGNIKRLRDVLAQNLSGVSPENRREAEAVLDQMNGEIAEIERALEAELIEFEAYRKARADLRTYLSSLPEYKMRRLREYLQSNPGTMIEVEEMLEDEFPG